MLREDFAVPIAVPGVHKNLTKKHMDVLSIAGSADVGPVELDEFGVFYLCGHSSAWSTEESPSFQYQGYDEAYDSSLIAELSEDIFHDAKPENSFELEPQIPSYVTQSSPVKVTASSLPDSDILPPTSIISCDAPGKKPRLIVPVIPSLTEESTMTPPPLSSVVIMTEPAPPGGPCALLNIFVLDPVAVKRRRGGRTAKEYRRSLAIPRYKQKRPRRDWVKARSPMYESRSTAASSRRREGGKFTAASSGWLSASDVFS